jgi:hypothetical protein
MLGFSTTEKLTEFLSDQQAGEWKIHLLSNREALIVFIAIAHNKGVEFIRFDPKGDGTGEQVSLNDLMLLANSLRQQP